MNDDLISRQQAIDALHCRFADGFEEDRWWNSTHVIAALKGLPSAQPELIEKEAYIRGFEQGRTQGMIDTTTDGSNVVKKGGNDEDRTTDDLISRQAAIDELHGKDPSQIWDTADIEVWLNTLPSAQPDAVTASLEELINDYGEDGYFIVDGVDYQANELLNELKINSSVGEKFRIQITKTIVAYFMKFGD